MKVKDKEAYKKYKQEHDALVQKKKKKELYEQKEWYTIRALLGNQ